MYVNKELYGRVEYFFVHTFKGVERMLAYVQWTAEVHIDKYGNKTFNGYDTYDFIEVECIDRCVGFIRINNVYYIFDKENQVIYE